MDEGLVSYLSGAIKGARPRGADLLWYGEFRDFPYDNGKGVFQVAVPLQQATYEFFPGWQPLTDLQIDLLFQNASLDMNSRATQLGKASSDSVHAWIPDLYPGLTSTWMPGLRARARPSATICRTRRWGIRRSGAAGGGDPRPHEGHGEARHTAGWRGEVKASGEASFKDNKVRIASLDLPLDGVAGTLEYDNEQTRIHNLKASLWNQPLTLDYQGRQLPHGYQADLKFQGQWDSRRQRRDIPALEMLQGAATGRVPWG